MAQPAVFPAPRSRSMGRLLGLALCGAVRTDAAGCSTARLLSLPHTLGTTCPGAHETLGVGESCTARCAVHQQAVGRYYCMGTVHSELVGGSSCQPGGTETYPATFVAGSFRVAAKRRRVPRMGLDFRDMVLKALAQSLVISPSDFARLEVVLYRAAVHGGGQESMIDIIYEIAMPDETWTDQVLSDLAEIRDSPVGSDFRRDMELMSYPLSSIEVVRLPVSFTNSVVDAMGYGGYFGSSRSSGGGYTGVIIALVVLVVFVVLALGCYSVKGMLLGNTGAGSSVTPETLALPGARDVAAASTAP